LVYWENQEEKVANFEDTEGNLQELKQSFI